MVDRAASIQAATLVIALTTTGSVGAIPNPQLAKDETPVVLECRISNVIEEEGDMISTYSATCEVREVVRADTAIEQWDLVEIAWQVNHAQFGNADRSQVPGPEFPTPPPKLVDGQSVLAYLRAVSDVDGRISYVPNIGMDSFEIIAEPASRQARKCRDSGPSGPIMANEKVCAEEALVEAQADLSDLYTDLLGRFTASAKSYKRSGDQPMADQAVGQRDALLESQAAWVRYQSETCKLAYYEYYPGSMARLVELDCLKALTDQRAAQLRSITSGSGDDSDRY